MFFMPVDLFKPYIQGQQQAVKDNWTDLFNSEGLRQQYVKTSEAEGTEGSDIFAANARNQYAGDLFNREDALGAAAQPGKLAQTGLNSDAEQSGVDYLRDNNYPSVYGSTLGGRTMSNLGRTDLGTTIQNASVAALQPQAQQLGQNSAQDIINRSQYGMNSSNFALAQQPSQQQVQSLRTQGQLQLIPQQTRVEAASNANLLADEQARRQAQVLQQNAPTLAGMLSYRGDSSTPANDLDLKQHTDATNDYLRSQGLINANQGIVFPPGSGPVINTYNPDGSILSTQDAVQTFDRMGAPGSTPAVYVGPNGRLTVPRTPAASKTPPTNTLMGGGPRTPGAPLPTGSDYRRSNAASAPGAVATTPNPVAAQPPVTEDQVNQAKTNLDALNAKKLALYRLYPGLLGSASSARLDMPFEGGSGADTPDHARLALDQLQDQIGAAQKNYDAMRGSYSKSLAAQRQADNQKAAADLLKGL